MYLEPSVRTEIWLSRLALVCTPLFVAPLAPADVCGPLLVPLHVGLAYSFKTLQTMCYVILPASPLAPKICRVPLGRCSLLSALLTPAEPRSHPVLCTSAGALHSQPSNRAVRGTLRRVLEPRPGKWHDGSTEIQGFHAPRLEASYLWNISAYFRATVRLPWPSVSISVRTASGWVIWASGGWLADGGVPM